MRQEVHRWRRRQALHPNVQHEGHFPRYSFLPPVGIGASWFARLSLASCALLAYAWRLRWLRENALEGIARDATTRVQALSDLAAALAQSRTRSEVVEVIIGQGMRIAGSDTCTLYMLDQSGSTLELLGERGAAPEVVRHIRRISSSEGNPDVLRYVLAGQSLWAETEADYRALFPAIASLKSEARRAQAFWSVPLVVEGRPLGLIAMGFYEPRKFSREDRSLVETLSNQCGQALARAMRTEREDETRRWLGTTLRSIGDAVIATDPDGRVTFMNPVAESLTGFSAVEARGQFLRLRREFLTRSSEVFLTSLDYQSTLATVAQLAVPAIADWCGVDLLDAHGKAPYQAAVAHIDPGKLAFARQLGAQYPPSPSAKTGAPEVIRTGKPELYATISDTLIK